MTDRPRTKLPPAQVPGAIRKLKRRQDELEASASPHDGADYYGLSAVLTANINAAMDDVFGVGTADAFDFTVHQRWFTTISQNPLHQSEAFRKGQRRAMDVLRAAINRLMEMRDDAEHDAAGRTLRAYEGMDLHSEIARAANPLYRDGHYANAIEDAVKALNALVRLRSGVEDRDGASLMEFVFAPKNPVLAFNELRDASDQEEQKGFMMMFSGAVAGLRNPRAHKLIQDDAERALEFIAFISLLAKLLDGATKTARTA